MLQLLADQPQQPRVDQPLRHLQTIAVLPAPQQAEQQLPEHTLAANRRAIQTQLGQGPRRQHATIHRVTIHHAATPGLPIIIATPTAKQLKLQQATREVHRAKAIQYLQPRIAQVKATLQHREAPVVILHTKAVHLDQVQVAAHQAEVAIRHQAAAAHQAEAAIRHQAIVAVQAEVAIRHQAVAAAHQAVAAHEALAQVAVLHRVDVDKKSSI